jgi:hypothetical protein
LQKKVSLGADRGFAVFAVFLRGVLEVKGGKRRFFDGKSTVELAAKYGGLTVVFRGRKMCQLFWVYFLLGWGSPQEQRQGLKQLQQQRQPQVLRLRLSR